jgi:bacillithiol synthase
VSDGKLPWDVLVPKRKLFLSYLRGDGRVAHLLGEGPGDDARAAIAVEQRRAIPLPHRRELTEAILAAARGLGSEAMAKAAARLAEPAAVVVVGGQQPGVAGGPLLAFAKAVGVAALAERLEKDGAGPVVPVWWIASEDHDLEEAAAVRLVPGKDAGDLVDRGGPPRRMLSRTPAPGRAAILAALGPGEHAEAVARLLPEDGDFGRHAAGIFANLLGPRGLVVVEPRILRPFARALFEKDVREPGLLAGKVREGNARIRAAGFEPVLPDPEGPLHFTVDGRGVRTRGGGTPADLEAVEERLSSDVVLRVLAQDLALPVAAQVCGPTEAEYLAAILPAREAVGAFTPCVVPRPGVTILERRVEEALRDLGADPASLCRDGPSALRAAAPAEDALVAEARRLRADLEKAAGDPASLPAAVRTRLGRASHGLEELAAAVERAEAERRGVGESRRQRVLDALLPGGAPQERRWSLLPFLLRHGPDLWGRIAEELSGPAPGHRVIRV